MRHKEIVAQLKALKYGDANPSEAWLSQNRELLLSQIKNTLAPAVHRKKFATEKVWQAMSVFLPKGFVYNIVRPVTAMFLILAMGVGGWIATSQASMEALPGEWLYSAKRAAERTQVAVVVAMGAETTETKLHVEFAKRRAMETKKLVSTSDPEKIKKASETVNDLKTEMNAVNVKLEGMKSPSDDKGASAETVKNIAKDTEQIKEVLTEVKAGLLVSGAASTTVDNLSDNVNEAKNLAKDTTVKGVEVMVAKHLQGDNSVTKEEVKEVISNQIQSSMNSVVVSKQNIEEVKKAMDAMQSEVKELNAKATSTQALVDKVDAAIKRTQDAAEVTSKASLAADQMASKAAALLSSDNLAQAVNLVKEVNTANQQAERALDNTIKAVQNSLPTVVIVKEAAPATQASSSLNLLITATTTVRTVTSTTAISTSTASGIPSAFAPISVTTSLPTVILIVTNTVK